MHALPPATTARPQCHLELPSPAKFAPGLIVPGFIAPLAPDAASFRRRLVDDKLSVPSRRALAGCLLAAGRTRLGGVEKNTNHRRLECHSRSTGSSVRL
ncbi:MAG: hypothetical protein INR71_14225 [Terriglobus roseus]|nr:hypothetical protein [Terriglobus roseus]